MKMKPDKSRGKAKPPIIIIIIISAAIIAALLVTRTVSNYIIQENLETIQEMALHDEHAVMNSLELRYDVLSAIADSLKREKADDIQQMQLDLQDRLPSVPGAKELFLVDDEGKIYKNSGIIAYRDIIDELCDSHSDKFTVRYNKVGQMLEEQRELLLIAVPADIKLSDIHFRYIMSIMDIDTLSAELKIDSYDGSGYSSIIDVSGNYIVNINRSHSFLEYDNFFDDLNDAKIEDFGSPAELIAEAEKSGDCTFVYEHDGTRNIAVITNLPEVDWYLVSTVPMSVFSGITNKIMTVVYILLIAVIVIVVLLALLVGRQRKQTTEFAFAQERAKNTEIIEEQNRELAEQQVKLNEALALSESANKAKSTFLFNMSHDIRTPMNAIIGFNNMAISHIDEKETVSNCLKKVGTSSKQLLSLINDVLDMARIEAGAVKCEYEPVDIVDCAEELIDIVKQSVQKKLDIETDFSGVEHKFALADCLHINRILTNILSNSVKYTPDGGYVKFSAKETASSREGFYEYDFTIEDNGIGMSEEFLKHIYEEFSREKTSTASGVQGTGLGMAITKRLIDLLGGTIDIWSKLGEGTRTTIHLEMEAADPNKVTEEYSESDIDEALLKDKKVLLVEDNELNREIAVDILSEEGMIVDTAEDGDIAVEKMKNAEVGQYDIILMDIQMPRMNGYEATKAIRALPDMYASTVPIVAMTANAFEEDKQNAFASGMNGHISKPIDILKLKATIAKSI